MSTQARAACQARAAASARLPVVAGKPLTIVGFEFLPNPHRNTGDVPRRSGKLKAPAASFAEPSRPPWLNCEH